MKNQCNEPDCLNPRLGRSNYCAKHQISSKTETKKYDDGKKRSKKDVLTAA